MPYLQCVHKVEPTMCPRDFTIRDESGLNSKMLKLTANLREKADWPPHRISAVSES